MPGIDYAELLQACFGAGEESRRAFEACAACDYSQIADATRRLLPLLYRPWRDAYDNGLIELAHKTYLTVWRQNRERWGEIASLAVKFGSAGIEFMLSRARP